MTRPPRILFPPESTPPWLITEDDKYNIGIDNEIHYYLDKLNAIPGIFTCWSCYGHYVPVYTGRKVTYYNTSWPYISLYARKKQVVRLLNIYASFDQPARLPQNTILGMNVEKTKNGWYRVQFHISTKSSVKWSRPIFLKFLTSIIKRLSQN